MLYISVVYYYSDYPIRVMVLSLYRIVLNLYFICATLYPSHGYDYKLIRLWSRSWCYARRRGRMRLPFVTTTSLGTLGPGVVPSQSWAGGAQNQKPRSVYL